MHSLLSAFYIFAFMKSIYSFRMKSLQGKEIDFSEFKGKTLLIVNTASRCGFTPQYKGLQELYEKYDSKGLVVLGFPCNQFLKQEPDNELGIQEYCEVNYGVTFPMFGKICVKGKCIHPLYVYLTTFLPGCITNSIKWNFTKFLIDDKGNPVKRFSPFTTPEAIDKFFIKNNLFD